jgi:hypothetical protein
MHPYEYRISMSVRHSSLKLIEISERLIQSLPGIIPWRLCNIGEERTTPKGQKLDGLCTVSWFGSSFSEEIHSSKSKPLEVAIDETLEIPYACEDVFRDITKMGAQTIFRVGLFVDQNSGLIFGADLVKKLADLNIQLQMEIWPPDITTK